MYLIFDTETDGLVNHKQEYDHPDQPHIVQLAAILLDRKLQEVCSLATIIRPDGWEMPPSVLEGTGLSLEEAREQRIKLPACDIHGITQEIAMEKGAPASMVFQLFDNMAEQAGIAICHNCSFDYIAVQAEFHRRGWNHNIPEDRICTMKSTTDYCKIPGKFGWKWPKLQELHQFLFGEEFEGAHDALADVRATARCFIELKARGFTAWQS